MAVIRSRYNEYMTRRDFVLNKISTCIMQLYNYVEILLYLISACLAPTSLSCTSNNRNLIITGCLYHTWKYLHFSMLLFCHALWRPTKDPPRISMNKNSNTFTGLNKE